MGSIPTGKHVTDMLQVKLTVVQGSSVQGHNVTVKSKVSYESNHLQNLSDFIALRISNRSMAFAFFILIFLA
jgi:hypothetical protein